MSQNCQCITSTTEIPVCTLSLNVQTGCCQSGSGTTTGSSKLPNLEVGVETKRDLLYMGKQVYSQLIEFGALPNARETMIDHHIADVEWIQVDDPHSIVREPGTGRVISASDHNWTTVSSPTQVGFSTRGNYSSFTALICVNYTKKSDPVIG